MAVNWAVLKAVQSAELWGALTVVMWDFSMVEHWVATKAVGMVGWWVCSTVECLVESWEKLTVG